MGKRELLLIVLFVAAGAIVYRVAAPPAPPGSGSEGGGVLDKIQRAMHGNRASATVTTTRTEALSASTRELRLDVDATEVVITGEDRRDLAITFAVRSTGYDEDEARRYAAAAKLGIEQGAGALIAKTDFPREASQSAVLTMKVPAGLLVRMEPTSRRTTITNVAGIELRGARGDTMVTRVAGRATITHRSGSLHVDGAGALELSARNSDARIEHVSGIVSVESHSGELALAAIGGPIDITSRGTEITIADISALQPPLRIDAASGRLQIDGLRTEARIDGDKTTIAITMASAVPLMVDNTGDAITIGVPPDGCTIDAIATGGQITVEQLPLTPSIAGNDQRVNGTIDGGGPPITLRATRAGITITRVSGK